jgi:hypothetical protein
MMRTAQIWSGYGPGPSLASQGAAEVATCTVWTTQGLRKATACREGHQRGKSKKEVHTGRYWADFWLVRYAWAHTMGGMGWFVVVVVVAGAAASRWMLALRALDL